MNIRKRKHSHTYIGSEDPPSSTNATYIKLESCPEGHGCCRNASYTGLLFKNVEKNTSPAMNLNIRRRDDHVHTYQKINANVTKTDSHYFTFGYWSSCELGHSICVGGNFYDRYDVWLEATVTLENNVTNGITLSKNIRTLEHTHNCPSARYVNRRTSRCMSGDCPSGHSGCYGTAINCGDYVTIGIADIVTEKVVR